MFHKVKEVYPGDGMILYVVFENGIQKEYDVKQAMKRWPVFGWLNTADNFKDVRVDLGGYGISWNDEIDLACDELWEHGVEVKARKEA